MLSSIEKDKVLEMRKNLLGYKIIAKTLGKSRDEIRNYCRTINQAGKKGYVPQSRKSKIYSKNCGYCGKTINTHQSKGRKSKFCSELCRRNWWKENPGFKKRREKAFYDFICVRCGKECKSYGIKTRKYCSRECCIQHRYYD